MKKTIAALLLLMTFSVMADQCKVGRKTYEGVMCLRAHNLVEWTCEDDLKRDVERLKNKGFIIIESKCVKKSNDFYQRQIAFTK